MQNTAQAATVPISKGSNLIGRIVMQTGIYPRHRMTKPATRGIMIIPY